MQLSEALDAYSIWQTDVRGHRSNTVRHARTSCQYFINAVGDVKPSSLTADSGDRFLRWMDGQDWLDSTWNLHLGNVRRWLNWMQVRGIMPRNRQVLIDAQARRTERRVKTRLSVEEFDQILDLASARPRDRIVLALPIYTLLRQGEMKLLRIKDVDLHGGLLSVTIPKSRKRDLLPISEELDGELRKWLTHYATVAGELQPDWHLIPGMRVNVATSRRPASEREYAYLPDTTIRKPEKVVHRYMNQLGYATRNEDDKALNEGIHTLRRSGARALFDSLCEQSYDGALRLVQSMLHHSDSRTTEIYLGLSVDTHKRDELVRGRRMYAQPERTNVVPLRSVSNG